MNVIGPGEIRFIEPEHELPHRPDGSPNWQESVVLYMWDTAQQCYAFLRLSHEPHNGVAVIWSNVWVPGWQYKRTEATPLQPAQQLSDGFAAPSLRYRYDGRHCWELRDGELELDLVMTDNHQPFDFFVNQNLGQVAPHHTEASGRVSGEIRFRQQRYTIANAIGHRDHSWGTRVWESIRSHRWTPAIFNDEFSLNAMAFLGEEGELRQFGFVVRGEELWVPTSVSICCHVHADGQTTRGAQVDFQFENGEAMTAHYRNLVPSAISYYRGYPCNDALAEVECDGVRGVAVVESGGNPTGGRQPPRQETLVAGNIDNGIFPW